MDPDASSIPQRAKAGPYGSTIAHGYLTLSLIPVFNQQLVDLAFGEAPVNYGVNKVRFPAAVPVGSRVRRSVTFTDVTENAAGTLVTAKYVLDAGGPKPACIAETLVLITN